MIKRNTYLLFFCLAANFLLSSSAQAQSGNYYQLDTRPKSDIDTVYPFDIQLLTEDLDTILSYDLIEQGKPTVAVFWMTTCYPCQMELNAINDKLAAWQEQYDFNFLAISMDRRERFPKLKNHRTSKGWNFPVYADPEREFRVFLPGGLNGLPQLFIWSSDGELVYRKRRFVPGEEAYIPHHLEALATASRASQH